MNSPPHPQRLGTYCAASPVPTLAGMLARAACCNAAQMHMLAGIIVKAARCNAENRHASRDAQLERRNATHIGPPLL